MPEDPVTGSANAAIMAFLAEIGDPAGYGLHYRASQGREVGRDGCVEVVRDATDGSISIGGACAVVLRGQLQLEIGRASCRGRMFQYGWISLVADSFKTKKRLCILIKY